MANEVHELAVAIRPEGVSETQDALDDTSEKFSETADDVGESTGLLSDFSSKFTGAGIVFAGAFGTMVGAIASRMPIISEVAAGLDAVLTALALRFDSLTRDSARPFIQTLFDLSEAIMTPGDELRALRLSMDAVVQGLPVLAAGFLAPIKAVQRMTDAIIDMLAEFLGIKSFMEDVKPFETIAQGARNALGGLGSFITQLGQDIRMAVVQEIINPVIDKINALINAANRLPRFNIPNIARVGSLPVPGINDPPGTRGPGGFTSGQRDQLREARSNQVVVTGTLESETNVDSRSVASQTKPFTVRGVLGSGRGARLR